MKRDEKQSEAFSNLEQMKLDAEQASELVSPHARRYHGMGYLAKNLPGAELEMRLTILQDGVMKTDMPKEFFEAMILYCETQKYIARQQEQVTQSFFKDKDLRLSKGSKTRACWINKHQIHKTNFVVPERGMGFAMVLSAETPSSQVQDPICFIREKKIQSFEHNGLLITFANVKQGATQDSVNNSTPKLEVEIEVLSKTESDTQIIGNLFLESVRLMGLHNPMTIIELPS